jgi:uncharacterized protein
MVSSGAMLDPRFPRHRRLLDAVAPLTSSADLSHDLAHLLRVYRSALALAPEATVDPDLAGAAALVHDLAAVPKEDAARPLAGERSAHAAEPLLRAVGYSAEETATIQDAVRTSSWSRGEAPSGPLGALLQDADRLDAIGAIGIARTFACAQTMASRGRPLRLYDPDDPLAARRGPDEARNALDHFFTKLLHLADGMHLPSARREARARQALMVIFLERLAAEVAA